VVVKCHRNSYRNGQHEERDDECRHDFSFQGNFPNQAPLIGGVIKTL